MPPGIDDSTLPPGANKLRPTESLEKLDTVLSLLTDPTLITVEMHAGWDSRYGDPSLPAAATVAMPAPRKRLTASVNAGDKSSHG